MNNKNEKRKRYFHDIIKIGGTQKNNFLGRTFSTKFFLKFCSDMVEPGFICFQILSYEPENRTKDDIEKASPWLKTLNYFYDFISLKETKQTTDLLINKLAWVLNRKKYQPNAIIKRAGERKNFFYLVLDGNILKLDIVIYRENLSLEEYLIYLIKMELINETEIINKCRILNKKFVEIKENSIKNFCKKNNINNYENLKKKAINELNNLGLYINENFEEEELNNDNINFKSIDNYLKIFLIKINPKRQHEQEKAYFNFYLPKYEKNIKLLNGYFFGNFLKNEIKENSTYISENLSNIGVLNKDLHYNDELYEPINSKKKKIFKELKKNFFIFHHIKEEVFLNNYAPFMVYKKYFKGEKIFLQNSCYEGIFLVQNGEIKITIDISLDDMYNLITYLTFALNGFKDYVSGFTSKDYINDQIKQQNQKIENHHTLDYETLKLYIEKKNYLLLLIKDFNILGTNESYDHQTGIYNFNAECISDEALVYFLPKENLNTILNKEKAVYNSLIQLVEFRIKDIIWKIKNYIKILENKINKFKAKRIKIKQKLYSMTDNNKNNINFNKEKEIKTKSLKNMSNIYNRNDLNYFSKTNFIKSIRYKNLFLSQGINDDIIYTYRNKKNKYKYNLNSTPIIPKLTNEKNRINEFNNTKLNKNSYSQSKKSIINSFPDNFPYLIVDSFVKRKFLKDNKDNILKQIKDLKNIKPIKIKRLFLNNNNNNY